MDNYFRTLAQAYAATCKERDRVSAKLHEIETGKANPLAIEYDRLMVIARKMHLWIWNHSTDEQAIYDELGLTDEENRVLGYYGSVVLQEDPEPSGGVEE